MNSPYTPPQTPLRDPPSDKRGATWKAIILGLLADIGGTIVFSWIAAFCIGFVLAARIQAGDGLESFFTSTGYQLFGLFYGSAFTCLGGYVAARIANFQEYRHGLYLGIASLLSGMLLIRFSDGDIPVETWIDVVGFIILIPAALYGAHLRLKQKHTEH